MSAAEKPSQQPAIMELDAAPGKQTVPTIKSRPRTLALPAPPPSDSCLAVSMHPEAGPLSPQLVNRAEKPLPTPPPQGSWLAIQSDFEDVAPTPQLAIEATAAPGILHGPAPASPSLTMLPTAALISPGVAQRTSSPWIILAPGELSTPSASPQDGDETQLHNPSVPSDRQLALQEATSVVPPNAQARSSEETVSTHPVRWEASEAEREGSGGAKLGEGSEIVETYAGEVAQFGQDEVEELEGSEGAPSDCRYDGSLGSEGTQAVSDPDDSKSAASPAESPMLHPGSAMSHNSSCESLATLAEALAGVGAPGGSKAGSGGRPHRVPRLPVLDLPREEHGGAAAPESAASLGGSTSKRKLLLALVCPWGWAHS